MNKTVIVINGRGGVGKDTLCDIVAKMAFEQFYKYMPELFEDIKPYTED